MILVVVIRRSERFIDFRNDFGGCFDDLETGLFFFVGVIFRVFFLSIKSKCFLLVGF